MHINCPRYIFCIHFVFNVPFSSKHLMLKYVKKAMITYPSESRTFEHMICLPISSCDGVQVAVTNFAFGFPEIDAGFIMVLLTYFVSLLIKSNLEIVLKTEDCIWNGS